MRKILLATVAALSMLTAASAVASPDPSELCTKPEVFQALRNAFGAKFFADLDEKSLAAARKAGDTAVLDSLKVIGGSATDVPNIYVCTAEYGKGATLQFQLEMMSNGRFVVTREGV